MPAERVRSNRTGAGSLAGIARFVAFVNLAMGVALDILEALAVTLVLLLVPDETTGASFSLSASSTAPLLSRGGARL